VVIAAKPSPLLNLKTLKMAKDQSKIKTRNPILMVACGRKGVGKTFTTKSVLKQYTDGVNALGIKPRKVLVLDVNDEFIDYKAIAIEDVIKFTVHPKVEARRIRIYNKDGSAKGLNDMSEDLAVAMSNFRGGAMLIEDISKIVGDSPSAELIGRLCTLRHLDCDVILHFQGIGKAGHPKILMNTNVIRLHWTEDSVERHKTKFNEKTEILKIGEAVVKNRVDAGQKMIRAIKAQNKDWKGNPDLVEKVKKIENLYIRMYVYISFDDNVIKGAFSAQEFRDAIFRYIKENQAETLGKRLKEIDRKGDKVHTSETAIKATEDELFDLYYGNES
jgi:hypothetical protein